MTSSVNVGSPSFRSALLPSALLLATLAIPTLPTLPSPLQAQEANRAAQARDAGTATSTPITLDEAIELARSSNPAYRRSVNDLELNEVESREFWLDFLPRPGISLLSTNMQWNRQATGTDNFGNPVPNPELRMVQSAWSDQRAFLSFELDLAHLFTRQRTRLQAESREVDAVRAGSELTSDVRGAFLDAQEMLESRELEERLAGIQETNREIAERRFRLAQVNRPDLLGAELDEVEQENQLEESRARLAQALLRLRNLIGDPGLGALEIVPEPLRITDPALLDTEALVRSAVESGPDVRQSQLQLRLAERDVSLVRAEWLPTLGLNASTGRQELSRESGSAFFQPIPEGDWNRRVGVTLNFPDLGTYFDRGARARRENVEVRNAEASLREARLRVEEEVRGLLLELDNQHRRLGLQERRAELARERLELQQERYRLGQIDYLELQESVRTVSDAERQSIEARYAFERALIDLERALGGPLDVPLPD